MSLETLSPRRGCSIVGWMYLSSLGGVGGTVTFFDRLALPGLIVRPVMISQAESNVQAQYELQKSLEDGCLMAARNADDRTEVRRQQDQDNIKRVRERRKRPTSFKIERGQPCQCLCGLGYTGGGFRQMTTTKTTQNSRYTSEPRDELVQKCVWCCLQLKLLGGQICDASF